MPYFAIFCYAPFWFDDFFKVVKLMATHMRSYISCLMWCKFCSKSFEMNVKDTNTIKLVLSSCSILISEWVIYISDIQLTKLHKRKRLYIKNSMKIFSIYSYVRIFWTRSFCWQLRVIKYLWQLLHPLCFTILYMLLF